MDLEQTAIERIKAASVMSLNFYQKPLLVCISGGKDSDVLLELVRRSGVPYEVQHSLTTVDAPQTVYHVRSIFKREEQNGTVCTLNKPKMTMWQLIVYKKFPPTRLIRYCCEYLKETAGQNRHILTGVRWDESSKRKSRGIYESIEKRKDKRLILMGDNDDKRRLFERCALQGKTVTNPIIDWKAKDIYDYISSERLVINPLYTDLGFKRVGCIGCPLGCKSCREREFRLFPTYKRAYIRAFDQMLLARKKQGLSCGKFGDTGKSVYRWWVDKTYNPDQISMFSEDGDENFDI